MIALVVLYIGGVLLFGTVTDFTPEAEIGLEPTQGATIDVVNDSVLSFQIWNLGYAGLGAESDFFFDNGKLFVSGNHMVYAPKTLTEKNEAGIESWLQNTQADFFLFQEVDRHSKRSHFIDQYAQLSALKADYAATFAVNYKSPWIPIPILQPWKTYGRALSGLGTLSRFQPTKVTRFQLPGAFSWPSRNFQLDRCVAEHRFKVSNGKELIVYNVHNSAHDRDGSMKRQEMAFLHDLLVKEYEKGNYVIAGGDWNQCPPYFRFDGFQPGKTQGFTQLNVDAGFLPEDWHWTYDPTIPSNRKCKFPYKPGETFITLIDFYLTSPNVQVLKAKTDDLRFQFSDHQPVRLEVRLVE